MPGNHEATSSVYPFLKEYLWNQGVHILENSKVEFVRNEETISLMGVKDPKFYVYDPRKFEQNLHSIRQTVETSFVMLLSHRPELCSLYAKENIDLAFCGHAHGGQIRIPKIDGLYAPNQGIFPTYTQGRYEIGQCQMIVSRGLGNSRAPQRVFNYPQLICVTLHKK